ncbi:hypothetical protein BC826DRAFT_291938 [Russula brevipes]|nr:hypothetical protein BC826DRAFT_291938 [Russula brevipes]
MSSYSAQPSHPASGPSIPGHAGPTRLSLEGRALLTQRFDAGLHFPSRKQKDALLRELQRTDPGYSLSKLNGWLTNRRRSLHEAKGKRKDGSENALTTLLDPTTGVARELWPSLSADTLHRLHTMLLEQPHLTVQHKELLANHFGVERKHVENFIHWRVACLHTEDGHPSREDVQRGHKTLPPILTDEGVTEMNEATDPHAHLPTPAGTISPEPVHRRTSFISHADTHSPPSVDTSPLSPGKYGPLAGWPPSPSPGSTHLPSPPPHDQRPSHAKPALVSPPSPPGPQNVPSEDPRPTRQDDRLHALTNAAAPKMPAQAPAAPPLPIPRTLREFEEAYAPTYARIELFLQRVERGHCAHIGLTPEMLKAIQP